eukprot:scaffold659_cov329-Prasinococcus_capsulatus_cf.AAC.40
MRVQPRRDRRACAGVAAHLELQVLGRFVEVLHGRRLDAVAAVAPVGLVEVQLHHRPLPAQRHMPAPTGPARRASLARKEGAPCPSWPPAARPGSSRRACAGWCGRWSGTCSSPAAA